MICFNVERRAVAQTKSKIGYILMQFKALLLFGITLLLAYLWYVMTLTPFSAALQTSASTEDSSFCTAALQDNRKFNSNLTFSPNLPLRLCHCFESSAAIFKNTSTKYTAFYPYHLPAFVSQPYIGNICRQLDTRQPIRLFIAIITRPSGFEKRTAIRETFLSKRACQDQLYAPHQLNCDQVWSQFRYAFFVGQDRSENSINERVELERRAYGDIVLLAKVEDYGDLTMKTLAILHWSTEYCKEAAFVLKLDDDSLLNIGSMLRLLDKYESREDHFLIGHVQPNGIPDRNLKSPYCIPEVVLPEHKVPAYAFGCGYLMPLRTARLLFEAGRCVATVSTEDMFVSGLLRWSLNVTLIDEPCVNCIRKGDSDTARNFDISLYQHMSRNVTLHRAWIKLISRQATAPSSDINSNEKAPPERCSKEFRLSGSKQRIW